VIPSLEHEPAPSLLPGQIAFSFSAVRWRPTGRCIESEPSPSYFFPLYLATESSPMTPLFPVARGSRLDSKREDGFKLPEPLPWSRLPLTKEQDADVIELTPLDRRRYGF